MTKEWDGINLADIRCRSCDIEFEARGRLVRIPNTESGFWVRLDRPCPSCNQTEGHFSIYGRPERWTIN